MANIFNFPPKKADYVDSDFLHDGSELVQFDRSGRNVSFEDVQPPLPSRDRKDWPNQELATIYRVKRLLDAAGVPNQIDRGLTDESDPWCVFCAQSGEVFIHLCRLSNTYVLDSPNLRAPLTGRDFAELIEKFSDGALGKTGTERRTLSRVVKLERGGKIFLHPATLLAALIWSIYLNSEELVLITPSHPDIDNDTAIKDVQRVATELSDTALKAEMQFSAPLTEPGAMLSVKSTDVGLQDDGLAKFGPILKDLLGKAGAAAAPSAMVVGLSSIAIAYGFMSEGYFDEAPTENDLAVLDAPEVHVDTDENVRQDANLPVAIFGFDLNATWETMLASQEQVELDHGLASADMPVAEQDPLFSALHTAMAVSANADQLSRFGSVENTTDTQPAAATNETRKTPEKGIAAEKDTVDPSAVPLDEDAETLVADTSTSLQNYYSIADFLDSFSDRLTVLSYKGMEYESSFDLTELSYEKTLIIDATLTDDSRVPLINTTPEAPYAKEAQAHLDTLTFDQNDGLSLLGSNAISYVSYLMDRETNVQIIAHDDEIVLIDFAAFGQGEVFAMSWTLEDGGTVQTVGLKSDFEYFDLIA